MKPKLTKTQEERQILRSLTRGTYDIQKLRVEMGNRLCAAFRSRLGLDSSDKEVSKTDAKKILDILRKSYKKITDGVKKELPSMKAFKPDAVIHTFTELSLISAYINLEASEKRHFGNLGNVLTEKDLYTTFLKHIKGCGPAMSSVIMAEFDIHKIKYASQMISYAGYGVEKDGKGTSKRAEHMHDVVYYDKKGKAQTRKGIRYNPWLKTKLWVLGGCLIKAGLHVNKDTGVRTPMTKFVESYLNYLYRLENDPVYGVANEKARIDEIKRDTGKGYSPKAHRRAMALRYMIKGFIMDLYEAWRPLEGLPVYDLYHTAKYGLHHNTSFPDPREFRPTSEYSARHAKNKKGEDEVDVPPAEGPDMENIEEEIMYGDAEEDYTDSTSTAEVTPKTKVEAVTDAEIDADADATLEEGLV